VIAVTTVGAEIPPPRPAVLAMRPATAAPKLMPIERIVGIDEAVRLSCPR